MFLTAETVKFLLLNKLSKKPNSPKRRVAIVISDVTRPVAFEWIATSYLAQEFDVEYILMNPGSTPFEENLKKIGANIFTIEHHGWRTLPFSTLKLWFHFLTSKPDVVHTHLLFANLAGLAAAFFSGVPNRIHTRHHSDPYHHKHKHARFYDWISQKLSTKIVAACQNVVEVLRDLEGVNEKKIAVIPFGVKPEEYLSIDSTRCANLISKFHLERKKPLIGMVSRYLEIKGLQYAIPAFRKILEKYPDACLLLTNAVGGEYQTEIKKILETLPKDSYREIAFEADMPAFYKMLDLFIHVPTGRRVESFGQAYTEPLAAAVPCIFTLSGVAPEFINASNALVVPFHDSNAIYNGMEQILGDNKFAKSIGENGQKLVLEKFAFKNYLNAHQDLWNEIK